MPTQHQGQVTLAHTFTQAHRWLDANGPCALDTEDGRSFEARAATTTKGRHEGHAVIRFLRKATESSRAYQCCWGRGYNCNGTRIETYCRALDREMGQRGGQMVVEDREREPRVAELLRMRELAAGLLAAVDGRLAELGSEPPPGVPRVAPSQEASMDRSNTVSGKGFYYQGSTSSGLTVYPTDRGGMKPSGSRVQIGAEEVAFVRREIRRAGEIPMGASRDNPVPGSLGEKLRQRRKSPQILSYVIPLLVEEGFCTAFKRGRRYIVRHGSAGDD
jgi:hypothetical protein